MQEGVTTIDQGSVLDIEYDPDLPIVAWRTEIAETIAAHQVVVIAGETGSGKTTQLPKICLDLGRRSIAHTQPRRIAARSVAERVAEELHSEIGDLVGYQVRFTRKAGRATRLKIMTDGVLLAEIGRDRDLRRYDTIIIDEAHERSLNIDFLLGYLRQLTARRPELKVIITSATIDTERFAAHFAEPDGTPAPIIEVSGRTYPVEVRYRPLLEDGSSEGAADQTAGICAAITELNALGSSGSGDGDILVFCSGERDIRDAADAITGMNLRSTEVLPLYARLSAAEQHRVFSAHAGRRIVLATNVAETSLTVPGIRSVIDTGTARISRYSARTKVQRLPIEPISQASANQRAGRCGRVAPGVCIRLYDEEDYLARPEFTEPEILRTNLAAVILQMTSADLGDIAEFPFVEAPDRTQITDGLRLLDELGALAGTDRHRLRLTEIGRRLAQMPVDPRMGRMLLAGERLGCLRETLVIVAGLSVQDPRERPAEHRESADALHRRFWSPMSTPGEGEGGTEADSPPDGDAPPTGDFPPEGDFVALLRLWDYVRQRQRELSGNAFRRLCRDEYLHLLRIREWQDLHAQLRDICRDLGLNRNTEPAASDRVHTAVLTGLLSQIGLAEVAEEPTRGRGARGQGGKGRKPLREYLGARGTKFAINPGSSLSRVQPPLIMAAEIVETTRLWARTVAAIDAEQVEEVAGHLLKRSYAEPHWSARAGSVLAYETVTLFGVPIVARRPVGYGRIAPVEAREIFIRAALVEGMWRTRHHFFRDNSAVRAEAEQLEERARRRDLVVDDQVIFDFYAARIPADVTGGVQFDSWWKKARHVTPDLLDLTVEDLVTRELDSLDGAVAFPDHWRVGEHDLALSYRFEPNSPRDGATVTVPVALLNQIPTAPFSWQVPGLRTELATELIRSLPKALRRELVPAPDVAARALAWLRGASCPEPVEGRVQESLPQALGRAVRALTGTLVPDDAWQPAGVPAHLRISFVASDDRGRSVAEGKDLDALRTELAPQVNAVLTTAAREHLRSGSTDWDFGTLDAELDLTRGGHRVVGYPALVDEQTSVGLVVLESAEQQRRSSARGLRRLVLLQTPDPTRWVVGHLSNLNKLALASGPYADVPTLLADARLASVGELVSRQRASVVDAAGFRRLVDAVRVDNPDLMRGIVDLTAEIITLAGSVQADLPEAGRISPAAADDVTEQVANLVFPGFVSATPYAHLVDLPRYLRAAAARLAALRTAPARDRPGLEAITTCETAYAELCDRLPPGPLPSEVADVGWLLEELRVSLFAQQLRTKVPVSPKRVLTALSSQRAQVD